MSKVNLFHREVEANKSPRNAFDIGYSTLFTSPAGELLPCYVEEVNKGDKIKLGLSNITRTRPLNTAAFMTFDEKVDFWFVPYKLIWSDYDNWRLAQNFQHRTTNLKEVGAQYLMPFCRYENIASFLRSFTTPISGQNLFYQPNPADTIRFLDLLGYSVPLLGYEVSEPTPEDPDRMVYRNLASLKSTDTYSSSDVNNMLSKLAAYYDSISGVTPINYFRLAAFQCIYMHSYRNEEFEELDPTYYNVDNVFNNLIANNTVSSTGTLNASTQYSLVVSQNLSTVDQRISLQKLFTPRYKNWRKDIFTALKPESGFELGISGFGFGSGAENVQNPSWQYGSNVNFESEKPAGQPPQDGFPNNSDFRDILNIGDGNPEQVSVAYNYLKGNPAVVMQQLRTVVSPSSASGTSFGYAYLYPQNIRNLLAQDKFSRAAIYADKNFSAQMKALFGEDVRDPHKPEYLGSYSANVSIQDVTATSAGSDGESDASTSVLGQLAGKCYNGDGKGEVFERTFGCDGIVMGIHYIMPRNNYDSNRIDKRNTKVSRWDFFQPQFDGLGLQPTFMFERNIPVPASGVDMNKISSLIGFSPRYYEYKQRVNEVHGAFMNNQADRDWTLSNNSYDIASASDVYNFKILPTITDRIFALAFDGSSQTDPFQHYYEFNVTRISNMEAYGTPSI
ncbi:major capsid protein [Microvirus mar65]|uniref:Major capsid protein n=1 Tax=Microvirus mar65 TaxID=2851202 RepID=A0A8F5MLU7_9VIRU|nr:major capsid protein [Microvirus mar65]